MPVIPEDQRPAFRLVPESQFSEEHLQKYPVWSELYDWQEREEIIGWGIDAELLDQEIAKNHDGSDHAMYPLLEVNPFPPRVRISVRARFRTAAGQNLRGYVVLKMDADPIVSVVHEGQEFGFSRVFPEWATEDRQLLQRLLPDPTDPILPLAYETDFTDEEGNRIQGTFDLGAV